MNTNQINIEGIEERNVTKISKKLNDITYINKLFKFYEKHDIYLVIRTCQKIVKNGHKDYLQRPGIFKLVETQHNELIKNNGYYFLIVWDNEKLFRARIIRAKDIYFHKNIMWQRLIEGPQ